jgi:hypothetical protein
LKCVRPDGQEWLRSGFGAAAANACAGVIYIQKISANGAYGQKYMYYGKNATDTFGPGWYIGERTADGKNLVTSENDITFEAGEGVIVYCGKTAAQFVVSGGVNLEATTKEIANGYSFGGNCSPVTINLADVKCLRFDGQEWLRSGFGAAAANACAGVIYLQKISASGAYGQKYMYYGKNATDTFGPGWYVGERAADGSNLVTADKNITFEPGEGWILYCGKDAAKVVIPQPIK